MISDEWISMKAYGCVHAWHMGDPLVSSTLDAKWISDLTCIMSKLPINVSSNMLNA